MNLIGENERGSPCAQRQCLPLWSSWNYSSHCRSPSMSSHSYRPTLPLVACSLDIRSVRGWLSKVGPSALNRSRPPYRRRLPPRTRRRSCCRRPSWPADEKSTGNVNTAMNYGTIDTLLSFRTVLQELHTKIKRENEYLRFEKTM